MQHISIDRQVKIVIGAKLLILLLLSQFVWIGFIYLVYLLAAFVVFSGISGFCPTEVFLKKLPYNKKKKGFFGL